MDSYVINDLFAKIESDEFYNLINLNNNASMFIKSISTNNTVKNLTSLLLSDKKTHDVIFERIKRFIELDEPSDKLHPYDHAVAIYLYVLSKQKSDLYEVLDYIYHNKLPNLWWTYISYSQANKMISFRSDLVNETVYEKKTHDEEYRISEPSNELKTSSAIDKKEVTYG